MSEIEKVADWVGAHAQALADGFVRFEWLAASVFGAGFAVISEVATVNREQVRHLRVDFAVTESLPTLTSIYSNADFYEREAAQLVGVQFSGRDSTPPAFDVEFDKPPLGPQ